MTSSIQDAISRTDPARTALRDASRSIDYGSLLHALHHERGWLEAQGVVRTALLADNGVGWVLADLALHLDRRFCLPLPLHFTDAQLLHAVDDAGVDAVLSDSPLRVAGLSDGWRNIGSTPHSQLTLLRRHIALADDLAERTPVPAGTSKVTYTSGSTDKPKGVCLAAEDLDRIAQSLAGATGALAIDRHLSLLPLSTLLENVGGVYAPLLRGACCWVPALADVGMSYAGADPVRALTAIANAQPNSLILVPELLNMLTGAAERGWIPPRSLQFIAVGGAPVSIELLARAAACGLPVFQGYGLSECGSVVCLNAPGANRAGSVGHPLPHAKVSLDERQQLLVSGTVMRGYLGDAPPAVDSVLRTGDLGEIDGDGYVHVRGRLRNEFISSYGRNLSPEWIERELSQEPGVRHALVYGEALSHPVAILSADEQTGNTVLEQAVRSANTRLPDYAQVRHWIRAAAPFSTGNGMLTANGRLCRSAVMDRYATQLTSTLHETTLQQSTPETA